MSEMSPIRTRLAVVAAVVAMPFADGLATEPKAAPAGKLEIRARAIFKTRCLECHSGKKPKGLFGLTSRDALIRGGESGRVITPGKPLESLLFQHVQDGSMPPGEGKRLPKGDVEDIRKWIAAGAPFGPQGRLPVVITQHDVYPILQLRCVVCHGGRVQKAQLDLRSRTSILKGGKSGPAAVLGKPGESRLLKKIHDGTMPPRRDLVAASIKVIEPGEIAKVTRWIADGMPLVPDPPSSGQVPVVDDEQRRFWAFRRPVAVAVPVVEAPGRVRNPIDAFLLKRLAGKGLSFSADADPVALLRRATLDVSRQWERGGGPRWLSRRCGSSRVRPVCRRASMISIASARAVQWGVMAGTHRSTACWRHHTLGSVGPGSGSTWQATRTPTAFRTPTRSAGRPIDFEIT